MAMNSESRTASSHSNRPNSNRLFDARFWGIVALILIGAALRIVPHPPNFTPIAAMALFGGAYLARPALAVLVSLAALFLSDLALGFHSTMPAVYVSIVLVALLGAWLKSHRAPKFIASASLLGSVIFFLLTNLSVWVEGSLYPRTFDGLVTCFVAALPFFRNSVAGDLFFTAVFFVSWAFAERMVPQLREA